MTNYKRTTSDAIAAGEIDERDLEPVSGGALQAALLQEEALASSSGKLSLKRIESLESSVMVAF